MAIELEWIGDDDYFIRLLNIQQKKRVLDFTIVFEGKSELQSIEKLIRGKALVLLFSGKGIITKKINGKTENIQADDILPNSAKDNFYIQYISADTYSFASVCRREKIADILAGLKNIKCLVKNIFIGYGPAVLANLLLNSEKIDLPKCSLYFSGTNLTEIKPALTDESEITVGDKNIRSSFFILLCAALADFTGTVFFKTPEFEEMHYFKNELRQKNIFQKAGSLVLVTLLMTLFGNYLAYRHYSQRYELLQEEVAYKQSEIDLLNTLSAELKNKQELIGGTGLQGGYRVSVLADKIAFTIPKTVTLTEMNVQPLQKGKLKENEKASFEDSKIVLKGKIFKSTDINAWIQTLKKEPVIRDVLVSQYNQPLNENHADFELTIKLN